jgi:hypothetical protein
MEQKIKYSLLIWLIILVTIFFTGCVSDNEQGPKGIAGSPGATGAQGPPGQNYECDHWHNWELSPEWIGEHPGDVHTLTGKYWVNCKTVFYTFTIYCRDMPIGTTGMTLKLPYPDVAGSPMTRWRMIGYEKYARGSAVFSIVDPFGYVESGREEIRFDYFRSPTFAGDEWWIEGTGFYETS